MLVFQNSLFNNYSSNIGMPRSKYLALTYARLRGLIYFMDMEKKSDTVALVVHLERMLLLNGLFSST